MPDLLEKLVRIAGHGGIDVLAGWDFRYADACVGLMERCVSVSRTEQLLAAV